MYYDTNVCAWARVTLHITTTESELLWTEKHKTTMWLDRTLKTGNLKYGLFCWKTTKKNCQLYIVLRTRFPKERCLYAIIIIGNIFNPNALKCATDVPCHVMYLVFLYSYQQKGIFIENREVSDKVHVCLFFVQFS